MAPDAANGKSPESPTHSSVSRAWRRPGRTAGETPLTSRAVLSSDPVTISPSVLGWKSRHVTGPSWNGWPMNSVAHSPVRGAHSLSEPSDEPVATLLPSGAKPPQDTDALCPAEHLSARRPARSTSTP